MTLSFGLSFLKGLFILLMHIGLTVTLGLQVLKSDKLYDSVCKDNSWIDGKFWKSFFIKRSQMFFIFFHVFMFFNVFYFI